MQEQKKKHFNNCLLVNNLQRINCTYLNLSIKYIYNTLLFMDLLESEKNVKYVVSYGFCSLKFGTLDYCVMCELCIT